MNNKFLFILICLFLIGIGAVKGCTLNGIIHKNGDEWVENGAYIMQCTYDSEFRWDIRLIGCALPGGGRLPFGSFFYDSMGEWQCLRRDCETVIRSGPANPRSHNYHHSSPEEGKICGLSAIRLFNDSCGGCNAYKCMDTRMARCGADGFLLGFAKPSCERFELSEIRSLFDNVGQLFIGCASKCLVAQIGRILNNEQQSNSRRSDCEALKSVGFEILSDCFSRCNFCGISTTNKKALTMAFQQLANYSTDENETLKNSVKKCEEISQTEQMIFNGKNELTEGKAEEKAEEKVEEKVEEKMEEEAEEDETEEYH
ncbi:hypothetical protein niasHS_007656 [Heterodera schachtii]|uniref:Abnormal cell migration protein 18-like fibronectin type I domain-containing protein n=1 Tax=Heterodera schachtii TaxID=97005 RepID=A0ABD2JPA4_HETSC